jgi:putative endonuclease
MSIIGNKYESRAAAFLQKKGLTIVSRNFLCKVGELDLVCRQKQELIFVEVRFRSHPGYGGALESITRSKQRKLIRAAQVYLQRHPAYQSWPCRFDVIAISPPAAGDREDHVQWLPNAFTT